MTRVAWSESCKSTHKTVTTCAYQSGCRSSIETLISSGFKPSRKVVLAFGFDEETSGLFVRQTLFSVPVLC